MHKLATRTSLLILFLSILVLLFITRSVRAQPEYDLNNDGEVDIQDIAMAASAFGSYPGHARWDVSADFNDDERIDMRDLHLIAINFR